MSKQAELIKIAIEKARKNTDRLVNSQVKELENVLSQAAKQVKEHLQHFEEIAPLSSGQSYRLSQLNSLKQNIDNLRNNIEYGLTNYATGQTEQSFRQGIYDGINEFKTLKHPEYVSIKAAEVHMLAASVFSQIDKDALDFLARYRLVLLGNVSDKLAGEIKNRISAGVISGKNTPEISREIGSIIKNPEKFKRAGKTVFKRTQERLMLICRTETNRAHNLGRVKFYEKASVKKVQWWSSLDNRTCPECFSRHGNVYSLNKFDPPPLHPRCRCCPVSYYIYFYY